MRRRNISALEIGRHLIRRGPVWRITIPGEETKNHRPLEVEVPRFLVSRVERYLHHWRPILCAGKYAGNRFWVSFHGKAMTYKAIGVQIEIRTRREFGTGVPPHAFRDAAATAIAVGDPSNYGHAAAVLGHARLSTTMRYYTIAGTQEAVTEHTKTLDRLRREATRRQRRTPE
jgi:integrase